MANKPLGTTTTTAMIWVALVLFCGACIAARLPATAVQDLAAAVEYNDGLATSPVVPAITHLEERGNKEDSTTPTYALVKRVAESEIVEPDHSPLLSKRYAKTGAVCGTARFPWVSSWGYKQAMDKLDAFNNDVSVKFNPHECRRIACKYYADFRFCNVKDESHEADVGELKDKLGRVCDCNVGYGCGGQVFFDDDTNAIITHTHTWSGCKDGEAAAVDDLHNTSHDKRMASLQTFEDDDSDGDYRDNE